MADRTQIGFVITVLILWHFTATEYKIIPMSYKMPKYYRFRATSPTRKPKRSKENDKERQMERTKFETRKNWINVTPPCSPTQSWFMRRTAWRENTPLMMPPKLAANLQASLQLTNRPIFVFKIPTVHSQQSQDVMMF